MARADSLKVTLLLASLALAGSGIAMLSSARNSQVRKLTPIEGVSPETGAPEVATPEPAGEAPLPTPRPNPTPEKVPDDIQWRSNLDGALKEARTSGKLVMVDFYTDWCGYCKKLDTDVYSDYGVITELVNFVSVKINAEKSPKLAQKYQVSGFPTIIWLDANGNPVETLPGYADAPEFLKIMRGARAKVPSAAA